MKNHRNNIENVVLISFGILEKENEAYFGKNSVISFAHELSSHFKRTYFYASTINGKKNFNSMLDEHRVKPMTMRYDPKDNLLSLIVKFLIDQLCLIYLINKKTAVIINSPLIWFTPVIPLLALRAGHLSCYMAANPDGVARMQLLDGGFLNNIKSKVTLINKILCLHFSDSLLICGDLSAYHKYLYKTQEAQQVMLLVGDPKSQIVPILSKYRISILYVGGFYKNKAVDILINSFKLLLEKNELKNNNLFLNLVGEGPEYYNLINIVKYLGIDDRVHFYGWIDDANRLADIYRSSDIFVLPSRITEGSPRVIDEAMYYGVPVIATDLGYSSLYLNRLNILLVKPDDIVDLQNALLEIILNSELNAALIYNGRMRIIAKLMYGTLADQYRRILIDE